MKILLVNPRHIRGSAPSFLHGLLQLCAEVRRAGHECRIADLCLPGAILPAGVWREYDVVGLSVMTTQLRHAADIARSAPAGARVVWGGVHCLLDPESILTAFPDHFVVAGEGEQPLLDLLRFFQDQTDREWLRARPGVNLTHGGAPVINKPWFMKSVEDLADVDYHDLPDLSAAVNSYDYYFRATMPSLNVRVARGCLWDCSFCINSLFRKHGAFHRSKSMDKIRREIEPVIDEFKIPLVFPADDDFFANRQLVRDWASFAREKGLLWAANCRFNYFRESMVTPDLLRDLMQSGLFLLGMSIEAGDESVRNEIINKKVSDAHIAHAIEVIRGVAGKRLSLNTSFIIDFPGDTALNKIRTLKWMDRITRELNTTLSGPQVYRSYPGSRLYEQERSHPRGDLDYYLQNTTSRGEIRTYKRVPISSWFYAETMRVVFSSRFRHLKLLQDSSGRPGWDLDAEDTRSMKRRMADALKWLLLCTVFLRLRTDFWKMFFEPAFIGALQLAAARLRGRD
jgi:radical SAM superfamily enzyme YgiQ (UPF0313 family)